MKIERGFEEGKRLRVIQPNILHMNYELVEE